MGSRRLPGGGWIKDVAPPDLQKFPRPPGLPPKPGLPQRPQSSIKKDVPMDETPQGDTPAQDSQQAPEQDSGLQTPQPDQPVPTPQTEGGNPDPPQAAPPVEDAPDATEAAQPVGQAPSAPPERDQVAEAADREAAREASQAEHARRTGGGDVRQGEIAEARDQHNERVGGGVPVQEASGDGVHDSQPDE